MVVVEVVVVVDVVVVEVVVVDVDLLAEIAPRRTLVTANRTVGDRADSDRANGHQAMPVSLTIDSGLVT